jgi:hypothetical protein
MSIKRSNKEPKVVKKVKSKTNKDFFVFAKSKSSEIRIELSDYKGKESVNIREWKDWDNSGELKPTKGGFTISPEKYRSFVKLMRDFGRDNNLIPESKK